MFKLAILLAILAFGSAANQTITVKQFQDCASVFGHGTPKETIAQAFIDQAAKAGGINSTREALMAVAQMAWESAGFTAKKEYACCCGKWEKKCENYDRKGCPAGQYYYGRGFIQLTHCYNYKAAAKDLNDQRIVNTPDIVGTDDKIAMATALWYWKKHVGVLSAVKQQGKFGAATKAILGPACGKPQWIASSKKRYQLMVKCLEKLKLKNVGIQEGGCYN